MCYQHILLLCCFLSRLVSRTVFGYDEEVPKRLAPFEACHLRALGPAFSFELDVRHSAKKCGVTECRMYALVILGHSEPYVTGFCCFGPASPHHSSSF
jgi:hypothetical protein